MYMATLYAMLVLIPNFPKVSTKSWIPSKHTYLKRRASRSHSSKHRISPSRTGPLTLRMMERLGSSRKNTRTWVTLPVLPVRPRTLSTLASLTAASFESWISAMVEDCCGCKGWMGCVRGCMEQRVSKGQ